MAAQRYRKKTAKPPRQFHELTFKEQAEVTKQHHQLQKVMLRGKECEVDAKIARTVELLNNKIGLQTNHSCEGEPGPQGDKFWNHGYISLSRKHSTKEVLDKLSKAFGVKPRSAPKEWHYDAGKFTGDPPYQVGLLIVEPPMKNLPKQEGVSTPGVQLHWKHGDIPKIEKALEAGK
tara:strand:- start:1563 stop:2090 length:528 start_codon:yes stop_codon:yes gene_type:complete